jgi:hypothetical protein
MPSISLAPPDWEWLEHLGLFARMLDVSPRIRS